MERDSSNQIIPAKWKVLSGSALKCIALLTMIIDHIGLHLFRKRTIVLLSFGNTRLTLYTLMRSIGRLAFPLYCFLLVEGFLHTHDRRKYGINLLIFALISEIPWDLIHTDNLQYPTQNVFFTLLFGFIGLCLIDQFRDRRPIQLASLLLLFLVVLNFGADYGVGGFGLILMLYVLREEKVLQAVLGCCFLSSNWRGGLAFIPINLYNGKRGFIRGPVLKFLFYAAYPVHILILYWIKKNTVGF